MKLFHGIILGGMRSREGLVMIESHFEENEKNFQAASPKELAKNPNTNQIFNKSKKKKNGQNPGCHTLLH